MRSTTPFPSNVVVSDVRTSLQEVGVDGSGCNIADYDAGAAVYLDEGADGVAAAGIEYEKGISRLELAWAIRSAEAGCFSPFDSDVVSSGALVTADAVHAAGVAYERGRVPSLYAPYRASVSDAEAIDGVLAGDEADRAADCYDLARQDDRFAYYDPCPSPPDVFRDAPGFLSQIHDPLSISDCSSIDVSPTVAPVSAPVTPPESSIAASPIVAPVSAPAAPIASTIAAAVDPVSPVYGMSSLYPVSQTPSSAYRYFYQVRVLMTAAGLVAPEEADVDADGFLWIDQPLHGLVGWLLSVGSICVADLPVAWRRASCSGSASPEMTLAYIQMERVVSDVIAGLRAQCRAARRAGTSVAPRDPPNAWCSSLRPADLADGCPPPELADVGPPPEPACVDFVDYGIVYGDLGCGDGVVSGGTSCGADSVSCVFACDHLPDDAPCSHPICSPVARADDIPACLPFSGVSMVCTCPSAIS